MTIVQLKIQKNTDIVFQWELFSIKSIVVKKYQYKKNQGKVPDDKENILNRDFKADAVYKKLVTDITYIHVLNEGWTYLASVMDLYDRKIIGWSYGRNITAELATQALKNALLNVKDTKGIIIHSDLGSQYTSDEFESYVLSKKMINSFSRKGNPYDNACIESFHSVLKKEEIYTTTYSTFEEAQMALFEYIESFYNRKRRHSALDYKTPQQVEDEALAAA
ncbi:MAG: IS3 family transposase [Pseudobutyrivibrio ruminis]|nr:IS3 family transposase [Pseudobutyrivibrio ruminis]